jgi:hypothetical protein
MIPVIRQGRVNLPAFQQQAYAFPLLSVMTFDERLEYHRTAPRWNDVQIAAAGETRARTEHHDAIIHIRIINEIETPLAAQGAL